MSLFGRLLTAAGCLAVGVAIEFTLQAHLRSEGLAPTPDLTRGLSDFPRELLDPARSIHWQGDEDPEEARCRADKHYHWADELIFRAYTPRPGGPAARLYMVYSRQGIDRQHHPETCIRDWQGLPEDQESRKVVSLGAQGERTVQRFRFRQGPETYLTVYYWHYTLEPPIQPGRTWLQVIHQRLNFPNASVTAQVMTGAPLQELETVEQSFLVAVDSAMRAGHLPETVRMGCERVPIGFAGRPVEE